MFYHHQSQVQLSILHNTMSLEQLCADKYINVYKWHSSRCFVLFAALSVFAYHYVNRGFDAPFAVINTLSVLQYHAQSLKELI